MSVSVCQWDMQWARRGRWLRLELFLVVLDLVLERIDLASVALLGRGLRGRDAGVIRSPNLGGRPDLRRRHVRGLPIIGRLALHNPARLGCDRRRKPSSSSAAASSGRHWPDDRRRQKLATHLHQNFAADYLLRRSAGR